MATTTQIPEAQLKQIKKFPDQLIFDEAKRRYAERRERDGKYAGMKLFRECKGCGKRYSARQMRSHECSVPYSKRQ